MSTKELFSFPKIHKEGHVFIAIFAVVTFLVSSNWVSLGWICFILTLWCVYFFRNPDRVVPLDEDIIVSPADGVVQRITTADIPEELGHGSGKRIRISIFLNVFDVHVNRVPVEGKVTKVHYHAGKFFNASLDKASIHNERNHVVVQMKNGEEIIFTQIAGLIARRIVCDIKEGQDVVKGERYGIIRFGSRTDIYLPEGELPTVIEGQRMIGGETIIARIGNKRKTTGELR